ncbi:unnamed protein product [Ilex paraguariensis]|uniref:Uncharacterized protein n=1 Tax=Ilex paraguariensis TaxID=185542 RepID=A0ABC8T0J3_9AQUA
MSSQFGFTTLTGSTQSELLKLQKEKLRAMDIKDTLERLDKSLQLVNGNVSVVAAELAIQSVELQFHKTRTRRKLQ